MNIFISISLIRFLIPHSKPSNTPYLCYFFCLFCFRKKHKYIFYLISQNYTVLPSSSVYTIPNLYVHPFSLAPITLCFSPPLPLYPASVCVCVCVSVVQCARREQLEHLQSSPLTAARHMAELCEGWVLSPGKVLTHRQERRAAQHHEEEEETAEHQQPTHLFSQRHLAPGGLQWRNSKGKTSDQLTVAKTPVEMNYSKLHQRSSVCRR